MRRFDLAIVNAFRSFSSSSFRYSDGGWSRALIHVGDTKHYVLGIQFSRPNINMLGMNPVLLITVARRLMPSAARCSFHMVILSAR